MTTIWYLDSVSGSTSNGGTAENDALASFSQGMSGGFTGGDVMYVKGGGATYAGYDWFDWSTDYKATMVSGYTVTPGDNCSDGSEPPRVIGSGSHALRPGQSMNLENFTMELDMTPSPHGTAVDFTRYGSFSRNITVHIKDTYVGGNRGGIVGSQGYRHAYGIRLFVDPGVEQYNSYVMGGSGVFRQPQHGCVYDLRNLTFSQTSGVGTIAYFNQTDHGSGFWDGCFIIGNSEETHRGIYFEYDSATSGFHIKNCVFYNLDVGIDLETSLADTAALLATFQGRVIIENCFFVNCRIGIQAEAGIEFPYIIRNNVFYNCTTAKTSGSFSSVFNNITATEDPIDLDNYVLTSYGKSLLNTIYPAGYTTVGSNPKRDQIYETPIKTKFTVETSGSLTFATGGVGDTVTVSGRSFQKISDNPIAWRRV